MNLINGRTPGWVEHPPPPPPHPHLPDPAGYIPGEKRTCIHLLDNTIPKLFSVQNGTKKSEHNINVNKLFLNKIK